MIECDALPSTHKLAKILTVNGTFFGSRAEIICPSGYELDGPKFLTCTKTGQWSAQIAECVKVEETIVTTSAPTIVPYKPRPSSRKPTRTSTRYTTHASTPTIDDDDDGNYSKI